MCSSRMLKYVMQNTTVKTGRRWVWLWAPDVCGCERFGRRVVLLSSKLDREDELNVLLLLSDSVFQFVFFVFSSPRNS